jgi:hypothetical protein
MYMLLSSFARFFFDDDIITVQISRTDESMLSAQFTFLICVAKSHFARSNVESSVPSSTLKGFGLAIKSYDNDCVDQLLQHGTQEKQLHFEICKTRIGPSDL